MPESATVWRPTPVLRPTVVADTACVVLHLTPQAFDELCRDDPGTAAELHAFVARSLASRLSHADGAIRALRD